MEDFWKEEREIYLNQTRVVSWNMNILVLLLVKEVVIPR